MDQRFIWLRNTVLHRGAACAQRVAASSSAGFSLIELLMVTAIFVILSSVMLANNSRFGEKIVLENMAYDVALSVRHAQLYGVAVRKFGASDFDVAYGVHFDLSSPQQFILFADELQGGDGQYDSGELVELTTITRGHTISDLCVRDAGTLWNCNIQSIDTVFKRPEPDAYIVADGSPTNYDSAVIRLRSARGQERSVWIERTGQIAVQ